MAVNNLTHKEITQDELDLYFFYRQHGIHKGFFLRYFVFLKSSRTTMEAFVQCNEEFLDLFGEYKYATVTSFRNQLKKYLTE